MKFTNRKLRKSVVGLLLMVLLACTLCACSSEPVNKNPYNVKVLDATSDFYVNDFAGILSEDQKSQMMDAAVDLDSEYAGIQVVVSIVESFEKTVVSYEGNSTTNVYDIEQLSYAMYDQYGIGQDDMGILIFFSVGDREVRIETGYQMQTYITDIKSGQLLDNYGMEYFKNDQFADGLVSVQAATIAEIKNTVPLNWGSSIAAPETSEPIQETEAQEEQTKQPAASNTDNEGKDTNGGLLFGIFGSIGTAIAAIGAFIYNLFTGKKRREEEAARNTKALRDKDNAHKAELSALEGAHKAKLDQIARKYKSDMADKQSTIDSLQTQLTMERNRHSDTKASFATLEDKFNRVCTLHPEYDFNQEVVDMIEGEFKASAKEVDDKLSQVIQIQADKDRIDFFTKAKNMFYATEPNVRKYIKTDISVVEGLLAKCVSLKREFEIAEQERQDKSIALVMHNKISEVYDKHPIGNYQTYEDLHVVHAMLEGLSSAQRGYLPDVHLVSKFQKVFEAAEADYENYQTAKEAEKSVRNITDRISTGQEDDRDKLARAKRYYTGLTAVQKAFFDKALLDKLLRLIREAESDHEDQERRRRQKRMQQSSYSSSRSRSSSSFSGSRSSFSGRGGRPSGGGASRRF